jgi:membrane protease YdiL (CAAX protease family)
MWSKFNRIFGIAVASLFFALGFYILLSPTFDYLSKEMRVIFAVFLFLYGTFRIVRYVYRNRREEDEDK